MLRLLSLTIFIILSTASWSYGFEIVAIKSSPAEPYQRAFEAFQHHFNLGIPSRGLKSIGGTPIISYTINRSSSPDRLLLQIRKQNPDLVVAFGTKALRLVADIDDIPIIYLLVPGPEKISRGKSNITGVLLQPKVGEEFQTLQKIMPQLKRIGVIYDPQKSEQLVSQTVAINRELNFLLRPVQQPQEVARQLDSLNEEVDLVWMLPDSTVVTPQTEKSFYLFSLQQEIPLLAFSEKYLKKGASFAVSLNLADMGKMAAQLALRIKNGAKAGSIAPLQTKEVELELNLVVIDKLGLHPKEAGQ